MMRESDVSVEISKFSEINCNQGDIIIDQFSKLENLVFNRSTRLFKLIEDNLYYFFLFQMILFIIFFFHSWNSEFSASEIVPSLGYDIIILITISNGILIKILFEKQTQFNLFKKFPMVYRQDIRKSRISTINLLIRIVLPAIAQSSVILYFNVFFESCEDGVSPNFDSATKAIELCLLIIFFLKVLKKKRIIKFLFIFEKFTTLE